MAFSNNYSQTMSSVPIFMNLPQRCIWYIIPQRLWSRVLYIFLLNFWLTYVIKENQEFNFLDSTKSWQMGDWSVVYIHLERFFKIPMSIPIFILLSLYLSSTQQGSPSMYNFEKCVHVFLTLIPPFLHNVRTTVTEGFL